MTITVVIGLFAAVMAVVVGQYAMGLFTAGVVIVVSWITHPVRYTFDRRYRQRTRRSRWG
jgi:hypothetical protein